MEQYIGVKQVKAKPMTKGDYCNLRNWIVPDNELPSAEGYLVEYEDGGTANVEGFDGYVSWSPADVFKHSYRKTNGMTFGLAIEALKLGMRVARHGWNGKNMWLSLSGKIQGRKVSHEQFWSENNGDFARLQPDGMAFVLPCITLKTADDKILMGWLASQTDMLADDYYIVL